MPRRTHAGDYVLKGERDLLHGKDTIRLRNGDAVFYDATVPHAARMVKGKPCRLLAVAAPGIISSMGI